MTNKVTVYVPTSKDVVIKGFTNAAYQQRITLDTEGIGRTMLRGSGEKNTPIGTVHFTTPADGGPDGKITIEVTVDYSPDGGKTWRPSDVYTDTCTIQAFNLIMIVSEDMVDQDYNDAICMISWPGRQQGNEAQAAHDR
jgi:hypothetical protein